MDFNRAHNDMTVTQTATKLVIKEFRELVQTVRWKLIPVLSMEK